MNVSNRNGRNVDRIAVAAVFTVAILILATLTLTAKSAVQPMPAAATIALSTSVGLPMCDTATGGAELPDNVWNH